MILNFASFNCAGIRDNIKRRAIFNFLKFKNYSVIFLQETHSSVDCISLWEKEWGSSCFFCHGTNNSRGTAILLSKSLKCKIHDIILDPNGRYIIIQMIIGEYVLGLASIYANVQGCPEFFRDLFGVLTGVGAAENSFHEYKLYK